MIRRLAAIVTAVFQRVVPDPLVIAIVLTIGVAATALLAGTYPEGVSGPIERAHWLIAAWSSNEGLWKLLSFSMQMCLILLGGHVLAEAPPVRRLLGVIAGIPRRAGSGAAIVGLVAMLLGLLNWGLGLIGGAILARETARSLARRGVPASAPLLAAAGYTGLLVWHGGLSGSAPLSMTTDAGAARVLPEAVMEGDITTPLTATIFSLENLIVTGGLLLIVPCVLWMLTPGEVASPTRAVPPDVPQDPSAAIESIPDALNRTRAATTVLGLLIGTAAVIATASSGFDRIGLNTVVMYLLALSLILHRSPEAFMASAARAAAGCAGIIVQFPLYAGIMGLMVASGLVTSMTTAILTLAGPATLEFWTMVSAGIVNILVPSGGGQWAVQGPIALDAARSAGIDTGRIVMAVAYGDELTNMLQPFWALPLLAITGVRARDIVGYTSIVMIVAGGWMTLWLLAL